MGEGGARSAPAQDGGSFSGDGFAEIFSQQAVILFRHLVRMSNIVSRNFALLDGDVNNLVEAGAIAGGINVRQACAHVEIGGNASVFELQADFLESKRGDIGNSAERKK